MSPRFHIHTLGCKVNRAESETLAASLLALGWEQDDDPETSDLVILNTCTVTGEADTKNRKAIRSLLRKSDAPLLVTGCAVSIESDFYAAIDERIVCESDKDRVRTRATELVQANSPGSATPSIDDCARLRAENESFRTRVDLKIQDGCDNACSYCIVHVARGAARSVPASTVLQETTALADAGVQELVLVGIDLAAYDDKGTDLATLANMLLARTSIGRLRISSVEPQSITPELVDAFGRSDGRLCRHLHMCLQSGCDKVLQEMHRHYDTARFRQLVDDLRTAAPSIAISTDAIVGFPGETEEDFEESYAFIEECGFMRLHVFRYSKRPGTPAARREDQIDPVTKAQRAERLLSLGRQLALADMERRLGTTEQVVIERPGMGTSESYHPVACPDSVAIGSLVPLEFYDIDEESLQIVART